MSEENDIDYAIGCAYNYLAEFGEDTKENLARLDRAGEMANIIEKQQKEIEELKEAIKERETRLQEEINENCKLKTELYGNSISKDKIRDKIKELENKLENFYEEVGKGFYFNNEYVNSVKMAINKLYELLEEK